MEETKTQQIEHFLSELTKSEEGKKLLQNINPQESIPKVKPPEVIVEPKKEDKKKKKNKTWWGKTLNKDKLKKMNKVGVIYLRNNGNADLMELETRNGNFSIDGNQYNEDKDCVYTITKDRLPLIIIREWDLIPIGTKKWSDDNMREKFSNLSQHVIKGIKNAELVKAGGGSDSKLTPKQLILWGLAALVGVIIIMNFI